jgi:hypothetical protein
VALSGLPLIYCLPLCSDGIAQLFVVVAVAIEKDPFVDGIFMWHSKLSRCEMMMTAWLFVCLFCSIDRQFTLKKSLAAQIGLLSIHVRS